jgi:hypothetical protein
MCAEPLAEAVDPRYPIGKFQRPETITPHERMAAIAALAELPSRLADALAGLDRKQLGTPYREGGWTVRQLVHHLADSHMVAYVRMRIGLTADPVAFDYNEKAWAALHDSAAPVSWSIALLENLHARWVMLLESLDEDQWQRVVFQHPVRGPLTAEFMTLLYAWHSGHHLSHIVLLRRRMDW